MPNGKEKTESASTADSAGRNGREAGPGKGGSHRREGRDPQTYYFAGGESIRAAIEQESSFGLEPVDALLEKSWKEP